ncbi:rhamnulokinase [Sunxiuqinia sp. A32]|uniref:rhamnulokinase n=1 Tax=Sunxiuqinia sp. A32 TaxID=3461496 RepID=UPI004046607F
MQKHHFLAFDLGASSGRAILGSLESSKITLTEVHRFENQMQYINGHFFWNVFSLFNELKTGLKKCVQDLGIQPDSIGVDTWGVDFVHLNKEGMIASLPFAYRDSRTESSMDDLFQIISKEEVYLKTGIQFMQFNSLFQLYSMVKEKASILDVTDKILFMPDALNYLFSGVAKTEFSIASTSQMIVPGKNEWQLPIIEKAGIPMSILTEIVDPGTKIGFIKDDVAEETGSNPVPVIAVAGHDTASAIAAVPAKGRNYAYISSGTWSLMGIESDQPLISEKTLEMNYTNEGGVEGTTRFLKNIMGMWLIQECRRAWEDEKNYTWDEMVQLAKTVDPFKYLVNPDDASFLNPGNMPKAIVEFCKKTNQGTPSTHAEIIRCVYDSLALKYRYTLDQIKTVSDQPIEKIHIIGGGANNHFLNQLTADATGLDVLAGPTEATATGNILLQAKAMGALHSLDEMREVVRNSFEVITFTPQKELNWEKAYLNFVNLVE